MNWRVHLSHNEAVQFAADNNLDELKQKDELKKF